jgi:membrane-associated protein
VIDLTALQVASPTSYLIAFVIPGLDAIFPLLPSETAIVALGVATAGSTDLRIVALLLLAALGAFLGDNLSYLLGRWFGPSVDRRFFAGEKGARRRAWAEHALERFGARLVLVCRFVPGGRTAVTLTCGLVRYPQRKFLWATAIAGATWASYAFFLGRLGGKAFEGRPWAGLLVALAGSFVLAASVEVGRRAPRWMRRGHDRSGP